MKGQNAKQGAKGTENLLGKGESKPQVQGKFKA
jgi:2-dehydropantoate 2-reductase